ncbi:MAG: radical SAM protein [Coriobacteriales bacterium]|nr:radical SAM protein [Coriobacteriales bacterium]
MDMSMNAYAHCELCPRGCGVERSNGQTGICGCTSELRVARAALHYWEEPPISGEVGSGAIFFSGCPLRCVFCQNQDISHEGVGQPVTTARLAQIMLELQEQGALNINLVTPLHYAPHIREALKKARAAGLALPILCNTSGYERADLVRELADVIDIWLTDFKYASPTLAGRLSGAKDYPKVARAALVEMLRQLREKGGRCERDDGILKRGIVVRHLVLPGHIDDSCKVLDLVWELCGNEVDLSVMNQYTPNARCRRAGGDLGRALSEEEYEVVLCHADDLGFERMWWQQGGAVSESFIPAFDFTGVEGPEL